MPATKAKPKTAKPKTAKAKTAKPRRRRAVTGTVIEYLLPPEAITDEDVLAGFTEAERAILADLPTLVHFLTVMLNAQRFGAVIYGPNGVRRYLRPRRQTTSAERTAYHAVAAVLAHEPGATLAQLAITTGYSRPYCCKLRREWRQATAAAAHAAAHARHTYDDPLLPPSTPEGGLQ